MDAVVIAQLSPEKARELAETRVKKGIKYLAEKKHKRPSPDWRRRMWYVASDMQAKCRVNVLDDTLHPLALAWEDRERFASKDGSVSATQVIKWLGLRQGDLIELGFTPDLLDREGASNLNEAWQRMLLEKGLPNSTPRLYFRKLRLL